ncbi:hypothetical protein [Pseudomonas sp. RIT-PI-S]|uniref:hypothetical protein n=1 Tax=Pseudomonas sp. RIT-PI-S TaxID=3035295 RepID=UPI0021D8B756|nr:hypothetical protein [Pseudomonas sp. RIT-PI-S]
MLTLKTARVPVLDSAFTRPRFAKVTYYACEAKDCWVPVETLLVFDGAPLNSQASLAWHLKHAQAHNQALFVGPNAYELGAIEGKATRF